MQYHYLIQSTSDIRHGSFDLLVVVPVMRKEAKRIARWQQFVGASGMHSFLSVPINEGKLRFRLASRNVGERAYPVIEVDSPSAGQFILPFMPSRVGERQARRTYNGIMEMAREYKKRQHATRTLSATGTGETAAVTMHPAASERMAEQQMMRLTEGSTRTKSDKGGQNTSADNKEAGANVHSMDKARKRRGSRIGPAVRVTGAGVTLGAVVIAGMMALSPAAAADSSTPDVLALSGQPVLEGVEAVQKAFNEALPVPDTNLEISKAAGYDGCSSGTSAMVGEDQSLSALDTQAGD